jgi:uncharacterized protein YndB with AHSA1/START domain
MRPVEVSAEIALPPARVWDFLWGDGGPPRFLAEMHRLGYWRDVTRFEDYEVRPDGTPRYRMSRKFGPLPTVSMRTEYDVFDRPNRAVNRPVDGPLRGDFVVTYEPIREGTRITWRWDVSATNPLLNGLLRAVRPFMTRSLQRDLNEYVKAATRTRT